jgi:hypothetical protein
VLWPHTKTSVAQSLAKPLTVGGFPEGKICLRTGGTGEYNSGHQYNQDECDFGFLVTIISLHFSYSFRSSFFRLFLLAYNLVHLPDGERREQPLTHPVPTVVYRDGIKGYGA